MRLLTYLFLLCGLATNVTAQARLTLVGQLSTEIVSDDSPEFRIWVLNVKKPVSMGAGPGWDTVTGQKKIQLFLHDNTVSKCAQFDWTTRASTQRNLTPYLGHSVKVKGALVGRILGAMYLPISIDVDEFDPTDCGGHGVSGTATVAKPLSGTIKK